MLNKKKIITAKVADIVALIVSFVTLIVGGVGMSFVRQVPDEALQALIVPSAAVTTGVSILVIVFISAGFLIAAKSEKGVNQNVVVNILRFAFATLLFVVLFVLWSHLFLAYPTGLGSLPAAVLILSIIMLAYVILNIVLFCKKDYIEHHEN